MYFGEKAKKQFELNIENRIDRISGYFKDENYWIAYDNTSREMFVEEFKEEKNAIAWLSGFDVIFNERIKIKQIFSGFYYISKNIFLRIKIKNEIITSKVYYFC